MPETKPRLIAPADACDCHIHVYDPATPLSPGAPAQAVPGPAWATVEAYRAVQRRLGLTRSVVVQPTAYGTDNRCTLGVIAALGLKNTRGVAVVEPGVSDAALERLAKAGIRGVRFHMLAGGILPWEALDPIAARIAPLGWHIALQMDGRLLAEREAQLKRLPGPLLIDHIGKFLEPVPVSHPGFQALLRLLDAGRTWLKLAGPYEVSKVGAPLYADVGVLAKAAVKAAPDRIIWGSNWPHVAARQGLPDDALMLDMLLDWAPDEATRHRILVENPQALYGF